MTDSSPAFPVTPPRPPGHVIVPALAICSLSILLVTGLRSLGILARLDDAAARMLAGDAALPNSLPAAVIWLATAFFPLALCFAILCVPGTWRRIVLWITTCVLVAGWAPVLVLAAYAPDVSAVLIAVVWAGVCALVYTSRHEMVCDSTGNPVSHETR